MCRPVSSSSAPGDQVLEGAVGGLDGAGGHVSKALEAFALAVRHLTAAEGLSVSPVSRQEVVSSVPTLSHAIEGC